MMKRARIMLIGLFAIILGGMLATESSYAAISMGDDTLTKMSYAQSVARCYNQAADANVSINSDGYPGEGSPDLLRWLWSKKGSGLNTAVYTPTVLPRIGTNDGELNCSGVLDWIPQNGYAIPTDFAGLGYTPNADTGSGSEEASFVVTKAGFSSMGGANVTSSGNLSCSGTKNGNNYNVSGCQGNIEIKGDIFGNGTNTLIYGISLNGNNVTQKSDVISNLNVYYDTSDPNAQVATMLTGTLKGETFADAVFGKLGNNITNIVQGQYSSEGFSLESNITRGSATVTSSDNYKFEGGKSGRAGGIAVYNIFGLNESWPHSRSSNTVEYIWSGNATYALYYKYLRALQNNGIISIRNCSGTKPEGYAFKNTAIEWCSIDVQMGQNENLPAMRVSVVNGGTAWLVDGNMQYVLNQLGQQSFYTNVTEYAEATMGEDGEYTAAVTDGDDTLDPCYEAGLSGMAWILCPALSNMEYSAGILDNLTQDMLAVPVDIYNTSSPTYLVWEIMRNVANIIMVIILIFIIFSQLTGFGIDNYGIKKMLPRLVIMAILINLSFYVCEIVVDLSDVVGVGLRNLFGSIGNVVANSTVQSRGEEFIGYIITAIFTVCGVAGLAAPTGITIATAAMGIAGGPLAVIIIILALLVILVSVLLFFLMLGARLLIVIGCIALAPVAFACFVLPNTQKVFQKWWDLFKAALIIFPICGALGGASYLIRNMVLGMNEWHLLMLIVALIAPFLPFFALPGLLKASIDGLGKVGGALTAMGNTFRTGISRGRDAVMNTDAAKASMQEGRMGILRRRVGMGENGQLTERGRRRLSRAQDRGGAALRQYAANLAAVQKDDEVRESSSATLLNTAAKTEIAGAGAALGFDAGTREAYYAGQFAEAASVGNVEGMNAALAAAKSSGMKDKDIASIIRRSENAGGIALDSNMKRSWAQDMATKYGSSFLSTDMELGHWMATGAGRTLGNFGDYASAHIGVDDIKKEDLTRLSGDSLSAMITSGKVGAGTAQQVLAENPNLSEDKKIMLGMAASGKVNGMSAADFKAEANKLMERDFSSAGTITPEMVESWVAPPQQRVFITQDESGGYLHQDQDVYVRQRGGGGGFSGGGGGGGNGGGAGAGGPAPVGPVPSGGLGGGTGAGNGGAGNGNGGANNGGDGGNNGGADNS